MAHILVVDDEHGIRDLLFEILNDEGHTVSLAENAAAARKARSNDVFDMVLLDIWMPDTDGVSLLKEWASTGQLTMPVVMMSGHATIETAVEATKLGALSFLEKPITLQKLMQAVEAGLKKSSAKLAATQAASSPTSGSVSLGITPVPMAATTTAQPAIASQLIKAEMPSAPSLSRSLTLQLDQPLREAKEQFDLAYFSYHLQAENGSVARVAEKTGLERTHLYRKLKQLGIDTTRGHSAAHKL